MQVASTPTHTFTLPFSMRGVEEIQITYAQGKKIYLQKRYTDGEVSIDDTGKVITTHLSQSDTLLFADADSNKAIAVQVRIVNNAQEAFVSDVLHIALKGCLDNNYLGN